MFFQLYFLNVWSSKPWIRSQLTRIRNTAMYGIVYLGRMRTIVDEAINDNAGDSQDHWKSAGAEDEQA